MRRSSLGILWFLCVLCFPPLFVSASVTINEVLFDPAGTDTGLENIELYNPDAAAADLSGGELYPDGIGYFSFPSGFSLAAKSFAVIHLRTAGTNDASNLYHSSPTANMGNSSGSVALFKSGGRTKDTIVDFVRYHKPGITPPPTERKTWESTAAEAELWVTSTFVDVTTLAEGDSIGLVSDGVRAGAGSWKIYSSASIGSANAPVPSSGAGSGGAGAGSAATATPARAPPPPAPAPPPTPLLRADAGPDVAAVAGTIVVFRGMAFGLDGEPLPSARFLWNFGDGSVGEGKSLIHVYYFPGTYRANLSVSSGEYAGSDWRTVTVSAPALTITEIKPGQDGFVELFNTGADAADLGGINLSDEAGTTFRIPLGTVAGAGSAIVFPNIFSGLNPTALLTLRDARGMVLGTAHLPGPLPDGASWGRMSESFIIQRAPTPGVFREEMRLRSADQTNARARPSLPAPVTTLDPTIRSPQPTAVTAASSPMPLPRPAAPAPAPIAAVVAGGLSHRLFLAASIVLGLATAVGIVWLKRMVP